MTHINAYGLVTAAGESVEALWGELRRPPTHVSFLERKEFLFAGSRDHSVRALLGRQILKAFSQVDLPAGRLGIILASTKGMSEDFIWEASPDQLANDPLTPLLHDFIEASGLKAERQLCISNACSSTLAALRLGQLWLKQGLDQVLILAADAVTPFVRKGFQSLKLTSEDYPRPFDEKRSGFFLGEAAAAIVLSKQRTNNSVRLLPVGLDTEGSAVTRPAHSGESLIRAARLVPGIPRARSIDLIITHGTGTIINDETEDLAYSALFSDSVLKPALTGSKWRVGHTLAVSGAIDTVLACEAIKRNQSFSLETTRTVSPAFRSRFLLSGQSLSSVSRVLISSLGFGGMHAVAVVEPCA